MYISLASPHLGTVYADSQLVSTGMWAIIKWSKCRSLNELALGDSNQDIENSLLFKLSSNGVLDGFSRIILVSSPKDQYVPVHSARMQVPSRAEADVNGPAVIKMAFNLLANIQPERLVRISVHNSIPDSASTVDSFIGRAVS